VSTSPTFIEQLLLMQIPKAQKNTANPLVFFCAFENWVRQSFEINVDEIFTCGQFHQHFTGSFYVPISQIQRNDSKAVSLFCVFALFTSIKAVRKLLMKFSPVDVIVGLGDA
jgi:hypothetical protein